MKKLIERYFEIEKEKQNIEKQLMEAIIIERKKTIYHRFKITSEQTMEFFDVKTGARHTVTPPAVGMHIESGSWRVFE